MLLTHNDIIEAELYFEQQHISDNSHKEFLSLLFLIKSKLETNTPIKEIKRLIRANTVNNDLADKLKEFMEQQMSNITDEDESVSLHKEALAGYTFLELMRIRNQNTQKNLIATMARMREALKENSPVGDIIDNEVKKYKRGLETFYRTSAKKAREYAYDKLDKQRRVRGWISVAILDNRTSAICIALHNKFYLKKDYPSRFDIPNPPPRHPNCRTLLLTVYEGDRITDYKGQKISTFLKQNPRVAEEILGKKKYRIFKTGKAQINSFIDIKGHRFWRNDEIIRRLGIRNPKRLAKINGEG